MLHGRRTLIDDWTVPLEAIRTQRIKDIFVGSRLLTRWIDIFDSYQPSALIDACLQVTGDRGEQGAKMEGAGWGRREPPNVTIGLSCRHSDWSDTWPEWRPGWTLAVSVIPITELAFGHFPTLLSFHG